MPENVNLIFGTKQIACTVDGIYKSPRAISSDEIVQDKANDLREKSQ
jgi:hypothetical protein